jgi:hypothetical protein
MVTQVTAPPGMSSAVVSRGLFVRKKQHGCGDIPVAEAVDDPSPERCDGTITDLYDEQRYSS